MRSSAGTLPYGVLPNGNKDVMGARPVRAQCSSNYSRRPDSLGRSRSAGHAQREVAVQHAVERGAHVVELGGLAHEVVHAGVETALALLVQRACRERDDLHVAAAPFGLSLIHISEPTRLGMISY